MPSSAKKQRKRVTLTPVASPPRRPAGKFSRNLPYESSSDEEEAKTNDDNDSVEVRQVVLTSSAARSPSSTKIGNSNSCSPKKRAAIHNKPTPTPTKTPQPAEEPDDVFFTPPEEPEEEEFVENDVDLTPSTQALSSQCWKCRVALKMPQSPSKSAQQQKFCHYAMHVHPLLQVPVCAVCVTELANSEQNDEVCHGCADEEDCELFLCDNCPRCFCSTCVAQAYGGGKEGRKSVWKLQSEEDGPWSCPACDPQPPLKALQQQLEAPEEEDSDDKPKRTVEEILQELDHVETEIQNHQRNWDDPTVLEQKRGEIAAEIRAEKSQLSDRKLKLLVDEEMETWNDLCAKHDTRLGDMISSLQEELEVVHGLDLSKVYKQYMRPESEQGAGEGQDDDDEEEPVWKRQADNEIRRRMMEEGPQKHIQNILSPDKYRREIYEEVEDLMTKSDDERECPGEGFRSTMDRPSREQIQEAIEEEDRKLEEQKLKIHIQIDDTTDQQEMFEEEQQTSQQGSGGVSRVRRDTIVGLTEMKVRKKKARTPPKPVPEEEVLVVAQAAAAAAAAAPELVAPKKEAETPPPAKAAGKTAQFALDLTCDDDTPVVVRKKPPPVAAGTKKGLFSKKTENKVGYFRYCEDDDNQEGGQKSSDEEEYYCPSDPVYAESDVVLSSPETFHSSSDLRVKTVKVSTELTQYLKPHQKEGVKFLWKNACLDYNVRTSRDQKEVHEEKEVGGCILAHSMGLGKSLTAITLMYTVMNHPGLRCEEGRGLVHTIMLIVPVNTIESWKSEFNKWTRKLQPSVLIYDLKDHNKNSREHVIANWHQRGGVLLVSKDSFQKMVKPHPKLQDPGPDLLILDEAHQCLANSNNAIYKALDGVKTLRRLLLTGSPFQNNALEYYRMVHWMRKGVLDNSEATFERDFARPIAAGMPSDATPAALAECSLKSTQLNNILSPYVHRKDATVLRESLPPLQQVILHVRQSKLQTNLYKELRRHERRYDITSFLKRYHLARPIHNHPACLLMQSQSDDPEVSALEKEGVGKPWWTKFVEKKGVDKMQAVTNGPKMIVFLHILTHSVMIGDKVVCFSQCLKTLDFIEQVLQQPCWADRVKSLRHEFPDTKLGGWTKGNEYLRIDGQIGSGKRGDLINRFNKVERKPSERVQLFLISSKAGGIGITLTAANRVVLFDSHFNPVVMNQALFRCYRFGQEKPVFAYRLLTEGTGEEKIYTRSVNKTGLSLRVIDGKNFKGSFTEKELDNLVLNDTWVQCDRCEKWRMMKGEEEDLPDRWFCEMNTHDTVNNKCDASEKDTRWYHQHFRLAYVNLGQVGAGNTGNVGQHQYTIDANAELKIDSTTPNPAESANKEALARNDVVLTQLLDDSRDDEVQTNKKSKKPSAIISKYYFHESLLEECEDSSEDVADASESSEAATSDGDIKPAAKATLPSVADGDLKPAAKATLPSLPDGDLKPPAQVTTTPAAAAGEAALDEDKQKEQVSANAGNIESAEAEKAAKSQRKKTKKRSSEVRPSNEVATASAAGAEMKASATVAAENAAKSQRKKTKKRSSDVRPSNQVATASATVAAENAAKSQRKTKKQSSEVRPVATTPTVPKARKPASTFSITKVRRCSSKASGSASKATPSNNPAGSAMAKSTVGSPVVDKSTGKVAVKESPSTTNDKSTWKVAVKESPSARATLTTDEAGVVSRFSPRLRKMTTPAEATKKRKRDERDSSPGARRRLVTDESKKKNQPRKRSSSPQKSRKRRKPSPVKVKAPPPEDVIELSSDEE